MAYSYCTLYLQITQLHSLLDREGELLPCLSLPEAAVSTIKL